jgi:hypothetical protein
MVELIMFTVHTVAIFFCGIFFSDLARRNARKGKKK